MTLHYSDLLDSSSITNLLNNILPDEVYNLAAQSHVSVSFINPIFTTQIGTLGSISILEGIRHLNKDEILPSFFFEMFGGSSKELLNEQSLFDAKKVLMEHQKFLPTRLQKYTENHMSCLV